MTVGAKTDHPMHGSHPMGVSSSRTPKFDSTSSSHHRQSRKSVSHQDTPLAYNHREWSTNLSQLGHRRQDELRDEGR